MTKAIEVNNISKQYGSLQALKGISLAVEEGELYGLIGPDGAGKTTLFRILTTLLLPDQGQARVKDWDVVNNVRDIRSSVGYMPGRFSLYTDLTVEENLQFFATVFGTTISENYDLIEDIYSQIEPFKDRMAGNLSGGMKQKLALSCSLIHRPDVLFLDEPTTGVDPVARQDLWTMLKKLKAMGVTILVSTPYMDEAAKCDRIAFLQQGEVLDVNIPQQIAQSFPKPLWAVNASDFASLIPELRDYPGIYSVFPFGQYLHVAIEDENLTMEVLQNYLESRNYKDIEVKSTEPGIEDTFMELMQTKNTGYE